MKLVKRSDAIRIAEGLGYTIRPEEGNPNAYYYLFGPNGEQITPELDGHWGDRLNTWNDLPQSVIERDGYVENFDWVNGEAVQVVGELDDQQINAVYEEYGRWGMHNIVLTRADVEALLSGKAIVWGQDEYTSVIYFTEEKPK